MKTTLELLIEKLSEYTDQAYYVGGFVRDKILRVENKDIDIEVFKVTQDKLEEILKEVDPYVQLVGKQFGVYKIQDLDISLPRTEKKTGVTHKDFDISVNPFLSVKDAQKRRDFTINAIYQNIFTGEIVDNYSGIQHLQDGIIQFVDKTTFIEDPLRVYRAFQFASRFDFKISESTLDLIKTIDVSSLPFERIFEETNKALLKSRKPSVYFELVKQYKPIDFGADYQHYTIDVYKELLKKTPAYSLENLYHCLFLNTELPIFSEKTKKYHTIIKKCYQKALKSQMGVIECALEYDDEDLIYILCAFQVNYIKPKKCVSLYKKYKKEVITGDEIKEHLDISPSPVYKYLIDLSKKYALQGLDKEMQYFLLKEDYFTYKED